MLDSTCLFHKFAGYNRHLLRMHNRLVTVHLLQLIISVRDRRLPGLAHRVQDLLGEEPGLEVGAGQQVAHQGALHTQHVLAHLTFKKEY